MSDITLATCPRCARAVPAEQLTADACVTCAAQDTSGTASVRPPDHPVEESAEPAPPSDRDPLDGWDLPGTDAEVAGPPPPAWAIVAGSAGFAALVGMVSAPSGPAGLRRGVAWAAVAAGAAAAALRVWELEPEAAEWAERTASGRIPSP